MKPYMILLPMFLAGCNFATVQTGTMQPGAKVFADRGGFTMRREIKDELKNRGYNVTVGTARGSREYQVSGEDFDSITNDTNLIPAGTKYIVRVNERSEVFMPYWCPFNGWWWWRFTVSVADQETGKELMAWSGRGCANSSMRRLDRLLDKLEGKR